MKYFSNLLAVFKICQVWTNDTPSRGSSFLSLVSCSPIFYIDANNIFKFQTYKSSSVWVICITYTWKIISSTISLNNNVLHEISAKWWMVVAITRITGRGKINFTGCKPNCRIQEMLMSYVFYLLGFGDQG
jgi:hypothetical protein